MENNNAEKVVDVAKDATSAKKYNKTPHKGSVINKYQIDEVTTNLVKKIKLNADIRHFTALSIVAALKAAKLYKEDDKLYVSFAWNKFTVSCAGLNHDYTYNKEWVINCIVEGINNAMDNFSEVIKNYIDDKELKLTENTNE